MNANPYFTQVKTTWLCATAGWGGVLVIKPKQRAKGKNDGAERGRRGRVLMACVQNADSGASWKGGTAEQTTSLCKLPNDTNNDTAQIDPVTHKNTHPLHAWTFLPAATIAFAPMSNIRRHLLRLLRLDRNQHTSHSSIVWENTLGPNRVMSLNWARTDVSLGLVVGQALAGHRGSVVEFGHPQLSLFHTRFQDSGDILLRTPRYAYIQVGLMLMPFRPTHNNRRFKCHFGKRVKSQKRHRRDTG